MGPFDLDDDISERFTATLNVSHNEHKGDSHLSKVQSNLTWFVKPANTVLNNIVQRFSPHLPHQLGLNVKTEDHHNPSYKSPKQE